MKACLSFSDLLSVSEPQITEMKRIGDLYPDAASRDACIAFSRQVNIVQGIVSHTYGVGATMAKKTEDIGEVAEIWSQMSAFCQSALRLLAELKTKYPYCGTPELYDLVLDYKLAADKRCKGAMEEAECQKMQIPKGLFPALS